MKRNFRILAMLLCALALLCAGFAMAEEPAADMPEPSPTATPIPTPSPEDLGRLEFVVTGPDGSTVTTVPYSEFTEGKYTLDGLVPGTYTVTEQDPENLLTALTYTFDAENSVPQVTVEVKAEDEANTGTLQNIYVRTVEVTPTPTPVPDETPTPPPEDNEKVTIPVTKVWDDMGNRDGNRPSTVIVHLLANGRRTERAVLNAGNGWSWQFTDMPKTSNGQEIVYTVEEDPVAMYTSRVEGFTITNVYTPPTTSATVSKVWADNNNAAGIRPLSIYCTLSNGTHVELNEANGWTATVDNLPLIVNGQQVTYTWHEQEVIGYTQTGAEVSGNTTIFTNTVIQRAEEPPEGKKVPGKRRGDNYLIIEDYGTPLGVEVIINHVGDCFD